MVEMTTQHIELSKNEKNDDKDYSILKNKKWFQNDIITKYILLPIIPLTALFIFAELFPNALMLDDVWHFNFEMFAVIFNVLIAIYCLSRYRNTSQSFFLFLGVGFIASASIDFLHGLVALSLISETSFLAYFIPQTWAAGRLIDATMLIVVFLKYTPKQIIESKKAEKTKNQLLYSSVIVSILVIGSISFSLFAPFPNIVVDGLIHRPYDAMASLVFIFSLFLFFQKQFHLEKDIFFKGLAGYIVISIFLEMIISTSINNFDTAFNIAHILKDVSYLLIILVLTQSLQSHDKIRQKLYDEIKQTQKQKEEFLTMISHELKTPLSPIIMWADALKEPGMLGKVNHDQLDAIKKITTSAKELEKLVNDVFDTYKLELGQIKYDNVLINSKKIIEDVIQNSTLHGVYENIKIVDNSKYIFNFYSDETRVSQILRNLVNNAYKFVPRDTGKIEINCFEKEHFIHFNVKDNGIGIEQKLQKNLFKKFYQIDTSHTREHSGTGLGLAICKGLVNGLGGEIWVNSDKGKGATFCFTIPKNDTLLPKSV